MSKTPIQAYRPDPSERYFDPFSALLLVIAMAAVSLRLSVTDWAENLEVTQGLVFWSVILGFLVGKSIYSARTAFLFCLDYGLILIPWQFGMLLFSPDTEWKERLISMAGRLWSILGVIARREQVSDNLLFVFSMAILFWFLSAYAGFILVRKAGMWRAVVPMGIAALVIESFDPLLTARGWYLAVYVFLALLIVARTHYLVNTKRWRDGRTYVPADASFDQTRIAAGIILVLVLFSWNMPALAGDIPIISTFYNDRIEPARQKLNDRISFLFSSLRESVGLVYDYYGDQMTLGSGSPHNDTVEMTVETPGMLYLGQRFYWRARVYDQYQDGGWEATMTQSEDYEANSALSVPDSTDRLRASFKFYPAKPILTGYSSGQPLQFSRNGEIQAVWNLDGTIDLVSFKADPYIRTGEMYEVTGSMPSFTEKELRSAGTDYPTWVTNRYLGLPDEITPRTLELAEEIANNYDNPYDIAQAITGYLRENMDYVEVLEELPRSQESVDWFLFDYQKGFCNYYATAEVVLLRAAGIPARLAVGYSQGEGVRVEDPTLTREERIEAGVSVVYTIRQRNAHAWPEVFFPGLGWVEFEPTVNQDPIIRPSGEPTTLEPLEGETPDSGSDKEPFRPPIDLEEPDAQDEEQARSQFSPFSVGLGIIGIAIAVGLIGFALLARQRRFPIWNALSKRVRDNLTPLPARLERGMRKLGVRPPAFLVRWAHYQLLPDLSKFYIEIDRALDRLGIVPRPSQTPAERAEELVRVLPAVRIAVDQLVGEYQLGTYSPYQANSSLAQEASIQIRRDSRSALVKKSINRLVDSVKFRLGMRGSRGW